jgi:hypothetical protein
MSTKGYIQTDGSDNSLQYAKKINFSTWEYREWKNEIYDSVELTTEEKIKAWESKNWRVEEIDILDYSLEELKNTVASYGYEILNFTSNTQFNLWQNNETFNIKDSIQLTCECLFEQEI